MPICSSTEMSGLPKLSHRVRRAGWLVVTEGPRCGHPGALTAGAGSDSPSIRPGVSVLRPRRQQCMGAANRRGAAFAGSAGKARPAQRGDFRISPRATRPLCLRLRVRRGVRQTVVQRAMRPWRSIRGSRNWLGPLDAWACGPVSWGGAGKRWLMAAVPQGGLHIGPKASCVGSDREPGYSAPSSEHIVALCDSIREIAA